MNSLNSPNQTPELNKALLKIFGYHQFRGKQKDIIQHLIDGNDALVVMATGSGKSLCYQLSGILREGVTVVISPLIALMRSQVSELEQLGLRAASWHSSLNWQQEQELESQLKVGELDFLYLSPEKLLSESVLSILHNIDISLFAIDEAHCIWKWGQDFRPEYQRLSLLPDEFPRIPRIALTATAGNQCKQAIVDELGLENAKVFVDQIDRANLYYWIQPKKGANQQLLSFINQRHQQSSGIVYCQTRKKTEETADFLKSEGFLTATYHAGLSADQRWQNQQQFLSNKVHIMVATVAFGMGINKPDIRFVAHMDLPRNLESYYQEIGRAGRDNKPADVWMVFGLRDYQQLHQWLQHGDYEAAHKDWEHNQLRRLLNFVLQGNCRRKNLLVAFDVELDCDCGHCDNCDNKLQILDTTEDARVALSACFRCGQNFGVDHLIKVIRGQKAKSIIDAGHHQLSLYGKGAEHKTEYWRSVFLNLLQQQKLDLHGEYSELVKLTDHCRELLAGNDTFSNYPLSYFKIQDYASHRQRDDYREHQLYQQLLETRLILAQQNSLLEYQVVPENTLLELLNKMPKTHQDLKDIEALGKSKSKKYGDVLLAAIETYVQQQQQVLSRIRDALEKMKHQQALENYALSQNITMGELASHFSEQIRIGNMQAEEWLPLSVPEWKLINSNWSNDYEHRDVANNRKKIKALGVGLESYWFQCLNAYFIKNK